MTNKEILEKVIEKAIKNGWNCFGKLSDKDKWEIFNYVQFDEDLDKSFGFVRRASNGNIASYIIEKIIFSHSFAKAFFGEECESRCNNKYCKTGWHDDVKEWQYHLQQMVISEDPIKYLEQFLDKEVEK